MAYPRAGSWGKIGPYANTITGRDQFIAAWAQKMIEGQWTPRPLISYFDVVIDQSAKPTSAAVFLNCPTTNDGNWAIFDNASNRKAYIIDSFVGSPPTKMACLLPGAFDGTYTSVGYIENGDQVQQVSSVVAALALLGYSATVQSSGGTSVTLRVKSGSVSNRDAQVIFGSNTRCSSPDNGRFLNGGYVMRSRANSVVAYKSGGLVTYGTENDLEILFLQSTKGTAGPDLRWSTARRFETYPNDMAGNATTGTIDGSVDEPNGPNASSKYRWGGSGGGAVGYVISWDVTVPFVVYVNPFASMGYGDTAVSASRFFYGSAALNLVGGMRYLDTQDYPWVRATLSFAGSGTSGGFDRVGWVGVPGRYELKSPYTYGWKVRYKPGGAGAQQGTAQLYSSVPGRFSAAFGNNDDMIVGDVGGQGYRACCEPWIGWGMSGDGAGDLTIIPGQLPGFLILHEVSTDPVNSAQFFNDGRMWKRLTKSSIATSKAGSITLCGMVGSYSF